MDCVVVSSLLGIVEQLQQLLLQKPPLNNPCFILPHDSQIMVATLKDKLHFLHAYLHKPKPMIPPHPDHYGAVEWLDLLIRDVAMKAEDEIEFNLGEIYLAANRLLQGEGIAVKACAYIKAVKACGDLHRSLQRQVKYFESIEVRIRDLQTTHTASIDDASSSSTPPCLQLHNIRDGVSSPSSKYDLEHDLENTLIGMEDGVEEIKGMLIQTSSSTQLQVVSIEGMSGTGKTTLAKKVYEDQSIVSHFDIQAWTFEGQRDGKRNLLIGILSCIVSFTNEEISKRDDEQLAGLLRKLLMGRRYLIVIDGLSSPRILKEFMSTSFPDDRNGSRVLITTGIPEMAKHTGSGMCIYRTRFLNRDESWHLFIETLSNGKCSSLPPELELIGERILEKCMGMPLLILLIGGLLATLNNSPRQWQDILFIIISSSRPSDLFYCIIQVCYNYLPTHLKACFLYFGVFRVNTEIHVKKLIKLWVAEGFVNPEMNKNKSLEEIAKNYLCDLINRKLVLIHKRSLDRKIKSCMLRYRLHQFCMTKAIEENIMITEYNKFREGRRWLSRRNGYVPVTPIYFTDSSREIRSLFYFDENLYLAKCWDCWPICSPLRLLRILDLSLIRYWHGMPSEIVNLVHLRYLALRTIGSLCNSQLFKLQSLQTLILSAWSKEYQLQLPCYVLDLPWLRHVHFDRGSSSYLPNLVQENLQTLSWFKVTGRDSRTTNFTKVPNLKELGIYIEGEVLPNALDSLVQLHQLEKLKVKTRRVERFNLPNCFPSNLKQLTLSNTYLSWEDMDIIGKLPNLDLLKLKDFAVCGPEWTPRDGKFLQLRAL